MQKLTGVISAALLCTAAVAHAHSYKTGDIRVQHPWTRATPPDVRQTTAFMRIQNRGQLPERLLSVTSPVAARVEVLPMAGSAGTIELPARKTVELEPGGAYVLLTDLQRQLLKGDRIVLLLRFERSGELRVEVEVQSIDSKRRNH